MHKISEMGKENKLYKCTIIISTTIATTSGKNEHRHKLFDMRVKGHHICNKSIFLSFVSIYAPHTV